MDQNNSEQPPQQRPAGPDAPDKETMDAIRRRRLEKLGGPPTPKKDPSESKEASRNDRSRSATPAASNGPVQSPKNGAETNKTSTEASAAPAQAAATKPAPTQIKITSATTEKRPREASDRAAGPPARKPTPVAETLEAFESRVLSTIFRITLDPGSRQDGQILLSDLKQELQENGEELRISVANLDSALMEACRRVPHNKYVLDYLLPCWKRITKMLRTVRGQGAEKEAIVKEARRLCMSNCIFALTMPELFGREDGAVRDNLAKFLVNEAESDHGICPDWLTEAVGRWEEDDTVQTMFVTAAKELSEMLSKQPNVHDIDYKPYVTAMKSLTRFNVITSAIAESPHFYIPVSAPNIERMTILGPFFRLSPLQQESFETYFMAPKTLDSGRIATAQTALRMSLNTHQRDLLDIINQFVRASNKSRERTLAWFAHIMNANKMRRALRVDEKAVSSDGFMMNITVTLDCLCEPFMDSTFSKVGRIDPDYFRKNPLIDIKEETKMNSDQKSSDAFYEKKLEGNANFITEIFFLTLAAHHYGSEALSTKLKGLGREIKYFTGQLAQMTQDAAQHQGAMRLRWDAAIKKYSDVLDRYMQQKMAIEGVLFDDVMQARSLLFMRYVMVFLLRTASGTDYIPGKPFKLPLPAEEPEVFKNYPEYMFEDVVKNANFIFRFLPKVMISAQIEELVIFCITFLRSSEYIKNPALKQGLVSVLFQGSWPVYHKTKGILGDALTSDKFATDNLLHSLMKFYIEIEHSGNFYDKFNIRYEIFQIFKCVWTNPIYKEHLEQESKVNKDFFVQYVNLLLNDTTYLLDECLSRFPKIHELQEMLSPYNTEPLSEEDKKAKTEELAKVEQQVTSYMQLANETIQMMVIFTKTLSEAFTMPEIVQRLADMLDYNLNTLVGEKSRSLKVEDMNKYHFHPRQLLAEVADIYLNLSKRKRFIEAIARDGRSYRPVIFDNATRILERFGLKSKEELEAWKELADRVAKQKELDDQVEMDLGDIPSEFEDPLMASLMEDPVILPSSRTTVDRKTIQTYLLSDPKDPFNRQPLSIEDVIPNTELKEKITAWIAERRAAAKQALEDKAEDKMDIDTEQ